jgi:hypothetical protein
MPEKEKKKKKKEQKGKTSRKKGVAGLATFDGFVEDVPVATVDLQPVVVENRAFNGLGPTTADLEESVGGV